MKIEKKLEWMRPYLLAAVPHLPKAKRIVHVGAWKLDGRYGLGEHAAIITTDGKSYRVYLHTHLRLKTDEIKPFSKIDLLTMLAHELAHTINMDKHTPAHKRLEARLYILFMNMLEKDGYISEEDELGET